jgi:hypothetical protein
VASAVHAAGLDTERSPHTPLLAVVYDARFTASVSFARRSEALGLRTHAIEGDMTRLWYDEVYHRWRERPVALAGLTAHGPMFCFAELARDVRMRLVFRAEHRPLAGAGPTHAFKGPLSMLSDAVEACSRTGSLGAAMADVVARCPSGRTEVAERTVTGGRALPDTEVLYTGVIAPAAPA